MSHKNFNQQHLALSKQTSALCISTSKPALSMSGCASLRPLNSMTSTPLSALHLPLWQQAGWKIWLLLACTTPLYIHWQYCLYAINGQSWRQCHGNVSFGCPPTNDLFTMWSNYKQTAFLTPRNQKCQNTAIPKFLLQLDKPLLHPIK